MRIVAADLPSLERRRTEDHLAACSVCRLMLSEVLRASDDEPTAPKFRPRVLEQGMVLCDRYRICGFIGMGAMGEVHRAEDLLLGKMVAVKTLNSRLLGSDRAIARLKLEVAAAHQVTHPNVCRIFDIGVDGQDARLGSLMFITMELLEGPTLTSLLGDPTLTDDDRSDILRQLANGLSAAHAAGVIHRDLKPENVIVTRQRGGAIRAVITDFGLAGLGDSIAGPAGSGLSGTPAYAAPERLLGTPATPASDVFSFGLVGLEVLLRRRVVGAAWDTRGLPFPWRDLIRRTLNLNPGARPRDGGAVVAALASNARSSGWRIVAAAGVTLAVAATFAAAIFVGRPRREAGPVAPSSVHAVSLVAPGVAGVPPVVPAGRAASDEPRPNAARRSAARRRTVVPPSLPKTPVAPQAGAGAAGAPADRLLRDVSFDSTRPPRASELVNPF